MSTPTPIITLDWLHSRCTAEENCLLWARRMQHGPVTVIARRTYKVRLLVWLAVHGQRAPKTHIPTPTVCGEDACLHPDHLTLVKRNSHQVGKKLPLLHRANTSKGKRKAAKLTLEQATAVRLGEGSIRQRARAQNITYNCARQIINGQTWQDYSNPFTQLRA